MIEPQLADKSTSIPAQYHDVFPFNAFNRMQSTILPQLLHTDDNVVVAAPTGSGKTVVHELAILHLLIEKGLKHTKCVLIAPNKALCQERVTQWSRRFASCGLRVMEITGDTMNHQNVSLIAQANIIVTTPEKWDSLTRSWRKHMYLYGAVDLLLLDEVHHLGEDRGSTLETVVVRMRILNQTLIESVTENSKIKRMRIVALSATLPNLADIGDWIQCNSKGVHLFDDSFRPVPLELQVLAYPNYRNPFLFEKSLDARVPEVIQKFSDGKQTLVFCSSKKGAETLSAYLLRYMKTPPVRFTMNETAENQRLQEVLRGGVAFHHAGLCPEDRTLVETLFMQGYIQVLCTTSTLAHGVNLPARLVVIKGTNVWRGKGYERLPRSMVIQMTGRAGRPGLDDHGVAIVMTSQDDRHYYERSSMDTVESTLPCLLIEAICAEITQTVIQDLTDAIVWIKMTYFYVRVTKNPEFYGFEKSGDVENVVKGVCVKAINDLVEAKIVDMDPSSGLMKALPEAHHMTKHVVKFKTMKLLMAFDINYDLKQLLRGICFASEVQKPVKRNEKKMLQEMMKNIKYPLKQKSIDSQMKAFVLMQASVDRIFLPDFALRMEAAEIIEQAMRILGALTEHCIERSKGKLMHSSLLLSRSFLLRQWGGSMCNFFEQFDELAECCVKVLKDLNINHYSDISLMSIREVQQLTGLSGSESNTILRLACTARDFCMKVSICLRGNEIKYQVEPVQKEKSDCIDYKLAVHALPSFHLISYDASSGRLLCYRKIPPDAFRSPVSISAPISVEETLTIFTILVSTFVGLDVEMTHTLQKNLDGSILVTENILEDRRVVLGPSENAVQGSLSSKPSGTNGGSKKVKKKRNRDENEIQFNVVTDEDGYKYRSLRDFMIVEEPNTDANNYGTRQNRDPNDSSMETLSDGFAIRSAVQSDKSKSLKSTDMMPNSSSFNPAAICSKRLKRTITNDEGAYFHDFRRSNDVLQAQNSMREPEGYSQLYDVFLDENKKVQSPSAFNSSLLSHISRSHGFGRSESFEPRQEFQRKLAPNSFFRTDGGNRRSSFFSKLQNDNAGLMKVPDSAFSETISTSTKFQSHDFKVDSITSNSSQQVRTSFEGLLTNKNEFSQQGIKARPPDSNALSSTSAGRPAWPDNEIWSSQPCCNRAKAECAVARPAAIISCNNRRSSFLLPPDDEYIKFEDAF